jgi:D-glycero-D-manno-heptose 1,7-bisphosphate phosphatase
MLQADPGAVEVAGAHNPLRRAGILLDRDGTLIVERHYLADPEGVELLPGAAAGLRELRRLGFLLVVVTNQSGLSRGYFHSERLAAIHARLEDLLAAEGVRLDGIYVCPHLPEDECACRKPRPGLVLQAAADLGFDPCASMVIGDKPCDLQLGEAVGARPFLVRTGYGAQVAAAGQAASAEVLDDLVAVAARTRHG